MVKYKILFSRATLIVALLLMLSNKVSSQDINLFEKNHWGFHIVNAINPANKINIQSKYAKFTPLSNYHFGGGIVYHFNISSKYAIQSGFIAEYRTSNFKYEWYPKNLYTDLNIKTYAFLPEISDGITTVVFQQSYQSFSIPVLFKYNFYQKNNFILSAKTGVNFRYYFQSSITERLTIGSSNNIMELYTYKIFINPIRSVEIDNQTALTFSFILKNKKLINISILANFALYNVNKGTIVYMRSTPLEQKSDVIVNDHYFGIGLSYLFTGVKNLYKKKNKNTKWIPKEDNVYY